MDKFLPEIKRLADRISETEMKRKKLAGFLREINNEIKIIQKIENDPLDDIKIVGIDGGISKKSLHGFDFMLVRAAGALFHYKKGRFHKVNYFPSKLPKPKPYIMEALSDLDWAHSASIERQDTEIVTAIECIDRFQPDVLLLDGSIVPHYSDRPSKVSGVYERYERMLDHYKTLYKKAVDTNTMLAGVVEDSRGLMFCNMIKNDILSKVKHSIVPELIGILDKTRDTNLLYWALERGERSSIFRYSETPDEHPVLKDLREYAKDIHSFYLKTAVLDRPVRVDTLDWKQCDQMASIILAISGHHSGYGLPVPLIEADNIVKLSDNEMEFLYSQIMGYVGNLPGVMKLRREQRPF